ncbi:trafficking protein particle complex subunit 6 [Geosmithia morbida]|uniref:Trafficking protein particle complex subunit 6 n=1 Tax=Geosmithia morbida TaxID=1094350 RepID=A0A9P4YSN0_9HYPO|nr:trafficking protein particle complex subunit 6 [Geosmithia morbida]KAF4120269.1 trafficking protein particle complex subunit 6 [Geosmithia morbida]
MSFEPVMPPYNGSDPSASFVSSSALDFLLIELVPLAYRVTTETPMAADSEEDEEGTATGKEAATTTADTVAANGSTSAVSLSRIDEDEAMDAVQHKLESTGYRVGQGLVERFSKDRPRFSDSLDVIKFLCKDFWSLVFGKNIDNLKTNHRGVYVLTDNVFRPFSRMSSEPGGQAVTRAQPFLWFPAGIVRGALAALGTEATVHAEVHDLPAAVFQIKTMPAKP